ncbi:uncharacterized protein LOC128929354 [Callithrix jacchus]
MTALSPLSRRVNRKLLKQTTNRSGRPQSSAVGSWPRRRKTWVWSPLRCHLRDLGQVAFNPASGHLPRRCEGKDARRRTPGGHSPGESRSDRHRRESPGSSAHRAPSGISRGGGDAEELVGPATAVGLPPSPPGAAEG